ncbi:MAG: hypothetical protein U0457_08680 [Candidatus Sericytochromatia bacterium]
MFKLVNYLNKEKKNLDIKVFATDGFLDNIKDSKTKVSNESNNSKEEEYFLFINKGIKSLADFVQNQEAETLTKSLDYFINALNLKNTKPEAYFFLSYIANMMGDYPVCINYLHAVEAIDPNFVGLSDLRDSLNENLSHSLNN